MSLLNILRIARKHGVVTIRYPQVRVEVDELYRGKPEITFELCMGCGACANACPAEAITIEDVGGRRVWKVFYGRCIYCARCQEVCPLGAISLSREFELASRSRSDLIVEANLMLAKCDSCGSSMDVTEREVIYADEILKASETPDELINKLSRYLKLCRKCKRRLAAESIAEAFSHE